MIPTLSREWGQQEARMGTQVLSPVICGMVERSARCVLRALGVLNSVSNSVGHSKYFFFLFFVTVGRTHSLS